MAEILNLRKKEKTPDPTPNSSEINIRKVPNEPPKAAPQEPEIISWSFTYKAQDNKKNFYIALAVLIALALIVSILFNNYSLGAFLIIAVIIAVVFSRHPKEPMQVTISPTGVEIGPRKYLYRDIRSFWVFYTPNGPKELSIEIKKWFSPYTLLPFPREISPIDLRAYLVKYIPEKEHHPSLVDIISRRLGV
jgi:hypothetical protein